tara:strand:- start:18 stop:407 length:390 start_codon:yes stop_codon:yes gene_type:complete
MVFNGPVTLPFSSKEVYQNAPSEASVPTAMRPFGMPPPLLLDSLALSFSNALFPILPLEPSFRRLARASAGESLVVLRGGLGGGGAPLLKDRWGEWWHEFRVALAVRVRRANNINNCAWWFGWWWCLFC